MKQVEKRLRAEWEQQAAILLAFPHTRSDWASKIDKARQCFLDIIESIIAFERVLVCRWGRSGGRESQEDSPANREPNPGLDLKIQRS